MAAMTNASAPPMAQPYCASCGQRIDVPQTIARFGERFCSEAHAEQFVDGVRAARIEAAARQNVADACSLPPAGQRSWRDYVKPSLCWGAPLLLLLAIPLLWSGGAWAAGGSLLSLLAVLACPVGMYFMMRAMMPARRDGGPHAGQPNSTPRDSGREDGHA